MTITILHLSDIHISKNNDPVMSRAEAIAKALIPRINGSSTLVILISGDIAQAGGAEEYSLAEIFLNDLLDKISSRNSIATYVFMAPGNHDCDFSGDQEVRLAIIEAIKKKVTPIPDAYINNGIEVQKNYINFSKKFEKEGTLIQDDPLWKSYSISVDGKRVFFDMLNASWMSTRNEQQGGLLFPFERYKEIKQSDSDLRIVTLHHPLNWYNQATYLKFRGFIHQVSDIIVTGHEHQSSGRTTDDAETGECTYIEGAALQDRQDDSDSGFNIITIDVTNNKFRYIPCKLLGAHYTTSETSVDWCTFRTLPRREPNQFALTDTFRKVLLDPGATLKHPSGIALTIESIYIYPDFDTRLKEKSDNVKGKLSKKLSSKNLLDKKTLTSDILIEGSEVSGKTTLLYRLFDGYHSQGLYPLLLRGKDLRRTAAADAEKYIQNAIDFQYGQNSRELYLQLNRETKILLIDDFDLSPINSEIRQDLLKILKQDFHVTLITVGENFEISEMFSSDENSSFTNFEQYQISPFGYERRGDLIRKWISIGQDEHLSKNDTLKIFDDIENLVESTRMQHIATPVPIFVLSLLQASASGVSKKLHNSSFAHYYYFLIVGALEKGGVRAEGIGPYLAACTHLSWFIRLHGDEQKISRLQFDKFVEEYSSEWTQTNSSQLLNTLVNSRLIDHDGDAICFTYPYSYYYFLGRYTSLLIDKDDVKSYLSYCVKNLYVRECANTLLFLAHHTGNSAVLDVVISSLRDTFSDKLPMTLAKEDSKSISALMAVAPKLRYKNQKPDDYRRKIAKLNDQNHQNDGLIERPAAKREFLHDMISLQKSIEIAGALLTHQFPNYQKVKKIEAIGSVFESSLRAIREIYSYFEHDQDELVQTLSVRLRQNANATSETAEMQARLALGMLLRAIAAGFIHKAGVHLTSPDLAGHVNEVMGTKPNQAYRLIKIAQALQLPGRLPRLEIDRLVRDESSNPCVMGPLQLLVLQRMYMYETDYDDKDWATSVFSLGGASTAVELRHRKGPHKLNWRE